MAFVLLLGMSNAAFAGDAPKVTANNYVRTETEFLLKTYVKNLDIFGRFSHSRGPYDVSNQVTVRANMDTLYSFGVFDLSPLTITLPEPGDRYQSLMVVSQYHSISSEYGPQKVTLSREKAGTSYVFLAIRTFMDPGDEADLDLRLKWKMSIEREIG